jgi:hypothetical protein
MDVLETQTNFKSLSIKDLLEARDLYHYHLMHKKNVVGTAIGLYLIRDSEPEVSNRKVRAETKPAKKRLGERRFDNSSVRENSWPCVLVMVREWLEESEFRTNDKLQPQDMVPKTLYMPDGRSVPVCVVRVTPAKSDGTKLPDWHWPKSKIGGGFPVTSRAQHHTMVGSVGCLFSDGHTTYALTNRHVCGPEGQPVYSILRGETVEVGRSSNKQITRLPFSNVYPNFPGQRSYLNLDVGLIEVTDVNQWTSQVYGIGEIGEVADLSEFNLSLRLIGATVIAHGAASGKLEGQVQAMFYRYKSIGGYDYISDFLIAPSTRGGGQTLRGDSGTVWHLPKDENNPLPRPIAVEWGGQTFLHGATRQQCNFALATGLSNVGKLLDVELIQNHNIGAQDYWGQMGHYSIATFACRAIKSEKLKAFCNDNLDRISFFADDLTKDGIANALKAARDNDDFVPLADVPDLVWKAMPNKKTGGRDEKFIGRGRSTGPEHPTHYADIDDERQSDGKSLIELCKESDDNIDVDVWRQFWDDAGRTQQHERGLLPFRIWQFFDEMVDAAKEKDVLRFLCAAGLVSHYVGDACQPLHGSRLADGYADQETTVVRPHRDKPDTTERSHVGAGVHSAYETAMIDRYADDLREGLGNAVGNSPNRRFYATGKEVAVAIVQLMDRSAKRIPPKKLVDAFIEAGETKTVAVYDELWRQFGRATIDVMADGARVLAQVWESAWLAGNGESIAKAKLTTPVSKKDLMKLYCRSDFVPSLDIDNIKPVLR